MAALRFVSSFVACICNSSPGLAARRSIVSSANAAVPRDCRKLECSSIYANNISAIGHSHRGVHTQLPSLPMSPRGIDTDKPYTVPQLAANQLVANQLIANFPSRKRCGRGSDCILTFFFLFSLRCKVHLAGE